MIAIKQKHNIRVFVQLIELVGHKQPKSQCIKSIYRSLTFNKVRRNSIQLIDVYEYLMQIFALQQNVSNDITVR